MSWPPMPVPSGQGMLPVQNSRNLFNYVYGLQFYPDDANIYNPTTGEQMAGDGTYGSFRLYPVGRQEVEPPEPEINIVDVPGSNFPLDLSETLTGRPLYKPRKAKWEFKILADRSEWDHLYSFVLNELHGKRKKIVRDDEPNYYWIGRINVTSTKSDAHNGRVKMEATLEPFKRDVQSSEEDWLWDPFSFDTGRIYSGYNANTESLSNIILAADTDVPVDLYGTYMPITPTFNLAYGVNTTKVTMRIDNGDEIELADGDNRIPGLFFDRGTTRNLKFKSYGYASLLTIRYRGGSL